MVIFRAGADAEAEHAAEAIIDLFIEGIAARPVRS